MASASVGDDGYGDDPTVKELEALSASLLQKEKALFVPSGTFGNQLAIFTHCPRGGEVILGEDCHIVQHEAGASAVIAAVQLRTIQTDAGFIPPDAFTTRLRDPGDYHSPPTSLLCLENAHSNGRVFSLQAMDRTVKAARDARVPIHLDGARIFNAAACLGVSAAEIAARADSVMFCLSKGLCAPIGSILAGTAEFIALAHRKRKIMGGQLRQVGVLAAAGILGLKEEVPRLMEDHEAARMLGRSIASIPGIDLDQDSIHINMVYFRHMKAYKPGEGIVPDIEIVERLKRKRILVNPPMNGFWRLVTHRYVPKDKIGEIAVAIREVFTGL
jgi:threonine aldolase